MAKTSSFDVVVVGGGILGVCAAYYLSKKNLRVAVVERESVGARASGRALGTLPSLNYSNYYRNRFNAQSHRRHLALVEEIGNKYEFRTRSLVQIAFDDNGKKEVESILSNGGVAPYVDGEVLIKEEPRLSPKVQGGLVFENTLELEPLKLTKSIFGEAQKLGANYIEDEIDRVDTKSGKVLGVVTKAGLKIASKYVVLANGAWINELLTGTGLKLGITSYRGEILRVRLKGGPLAHIYYWGSAGYASTKPDGLTWLGTTMEKVKLEDVPTNKAKNSILKGFGDAFSTANVECTKLHTACLRPISPDRMPIYGEIPSISGLFVIGGAGRNGILQGPLLGDALAALMVGSKTSIPIDQVALSRFL